MIVDFVIILLISLFAFYPDRMIPLSHTSLGRLMVIAMIVYFTKVDVLLGAFICVLSIYYYQMDNFEHLLNISEGFLWDMTFTPYEQEVYDRLNIELVNKHKTFRDSNCSNGKLAYKGVPVNHVIHAIPHVRSLYWIVNCETKMI